MGELLSMVSSQTAFLPISVVMSVYNGERYLREAIESILDQSFPDFEFIIIDDGSTDGSGEIISSYNDRRIKWFRQGNKGLAPALNEGIKHGIGKYVARMDADDISLPNRLKTQYDFLESHTNSVVVGSHANIVDRSGRYLYTSRMPTDWEMIRKRLPLSPFIYHSSAMFRRESFNHCGGYYEKIKHHFEDAILWNKMAKLGELWNIDEPLINYRLVPSSISNRDKQTAAYIYSLAEKVLQNDNIEEDDLVKLERKVDRRSYWWRESNYYLRVGKIFIEQDFDRIRAGKNLLFSLFYYPVNYIAWFNFVLLFLPRSVINKWKSSRH